MTHQFSLENIQDEWEKNSKIDYSNLGTESIRIPVIHDKYLKIFIDERIRLKGMEFELSKLVRSKTNYYKGEMTEDELEERGWEQFQGRLLKNEISNYIETDDDYIKIKQNIVVQQEKINYLDSIIKQLNNRVFQIKNALDWLKFSRGT
ncbi:MAG: recombination mediator protein UvsY [Candidatus Neomarinimicrobiota bacterium]|nr:recombination mediator protein UvsY [Candidatus Neomarinimicrobiota bacterium]